MTAKKSSIDPIPLADRLTTSEMRQLVFADNHEAQEYFAQVFAGDLRDAIQELTRAYNQFQDISKTIARLRQPATALLFAHSAINAVLTSLHLLVSGLPVPAGNLMRHFAESVAMALLCADKGAGVYEVYDADRRRYPVHKSLDLIVRKDIARSLQKNLGLDKAKFARFAEQIRFYDHLSHASALSVAYGMMFTKTGGLVLGAQVDPSKRRQYKSELRSRRNAASMVNGLLEVLDRVLDKQP